MKRLIISLILLIFFMGGRDVFAQATVEGKLILPEPAPGREYWVLVDQDFNGDNGFVKYCGGICGSDTAVSYTISDVPAGTYYIYAGVRIVSYFGNPPEVGDYLGIYGGTIDEYPSEPKAVVPASGTVTFDIIMSKWTWNVDVPNISSTYFLNDFALRHNFPNPFNMTTTILFDVPKTTHITIKIYNLLGREVKTLVDRTYQPGSHTIFWNGSDDNEMPVTSGVYFAHMRSQDFLTVKKMLLLK